MPGKQVSFSSSTAYPSPSARGYEKSKTLKGKSNPRFLLELWEKLCNKSWFKYANQASFLTYYAVLAVYAITNLILLMLGVNVSLSHAGMIAVLFTTCAITNELIDMLVTVNPKISFTKAWFNRSDWGWSIPMMAVGTLMTVALSLYELYSRTINMVYLQLNSLKQYDIVLPSVFAKMYYSVFASTAVIYLLTNALNLTNKYLVTNVFSHNDHDNDSSMPLLAKGESVEKYTSNNQPSPNVLSRALTWYLQNPFVTFLGSMIGASLYAIGDSMQMSALFSVLHNHRLLMIPSMVSTTLVSAFFLSTLFERLSIWGYNFQYFNESTIKHNDKTAYDDVDNNPVIDLMQQGPGVRSFFTYGRIMLVCVLNIAGGMLHFKGFARFMSVLTSLGYCLQQRIQLSFQASAEAKQADKSKAVGRIVNAIKSNVMNTSRAVIKSIGFERYDGSESGCKNGCPCKH